MSTAFSACVRRIGKSQIECWQMSRWWFDFWWAQTRNVFVGNVLRSIGYSYPAHWAGGGTMWPWGAIRLLYSYPAHWAGVGTTPIDRTAPLRYSYPAHWAGVGTQG